MKNIIIAALIFSGIVGFTFYFGIIKIAVPENLFGRADKISSNNFQFVGKLNLSDNRQNFDLKNDSKKSASLEISSLPAQAGQPVKKTNITSIVAPIISLAATSTDIKPSVETIAPVVLPIISQDSPNLNTIINIGISEILVGIDGNVNYEFIELYNSNDVAIDLTGYSIKKRSSTGNESPLVSASRFDGKKIMPNKYFLLVNEGGYSGVVQSDIVWPKSYILAYKNNAVILYNANGEVIEDIGWDEIAKGQSLERVFSDNVSWIKGEFKIQNTPTPQNSQK